MKKFTLFVALFFLFLIFIQINAISQEKDSSLLSVDRIFHSTDFMPERFGPAHWIDDGNAYTIIERSDDSLRRREIVRYETSSGKRDILVPADKLIPEGLEAPLRIAGFQWSNDKQKLLIFTNTKRVWRQNTRGDYWVLDLNTWKLDKLGGDLPESCLMFAKFSPDDSKVGYVCKHNIYVEDVNTHEIIQLTFDGTETLINGTFDWAYEEELSCQDGFLWSPDSKSIAYWQLDASGIDNFLMINNTDSIYSYTIPVQYPKAGKTPSGARIGIISAEGGSTTLLEIPGDPFQHYLPRMMWLDNSTGIIVQQLNRLQNTNKLWICDKKDGTSKNIFTDSDEAWVDVVDDWRWLNEGVEFLWVSQKDGWRHLYRIAVGDGSQKLITPGDYDVVSIAGFDKNEKYVYFIASPDNPTQRYLYKTSLDGKGKLEKITPTDLRGTHTYNISPDAAYAFHNWSGVNTAPTTDLVSLPKHKSIRTLAENSSFKEALSLLSKKPIEFFDVTTEDGIEMQGWMLKPPDFDPTKKYPVLFYVYGEPWGQTARDAFDWMGLWHVLIAQKGYVVITMDNRGTLCPKGREWRKSIYKKVGVINSHDQAMATKEIIKWDFIDANRLAVWGWSGGGTMTLNLLFRYPEIYSTGLAVAAVSNHLYYDNIYQERYMGLPSENEEEYKEGSPITYAKNLEGNLLIVHGTADDNVHYQNAEALINELIKHNKQFQIMPYPNRSHGIYEGRNTTRHLFTLLLNFLMDNTEPGGK